MSAKTDNPSEVGMHIFERCGMGVAPYQFIGCEETLFVAYPGATPRAGGTCDYCATAISTKYWVRSADGEKFGLGCNCIDKSGDAGLIKAYKNSPEHRALQKAKRQALDDRKSVEIEQLLELHSAKLASIQIKKWNGEMESQLDYLERVLPMCGASGRASYLKHIKNLVK